MEEIALAIGLVEAGTTLVTKLIANGQQAGTLSDADAAAYQQKMADLFASRAWKTDAEAGR